MSDSPAPHNIEAALRVAVDYMSDEVASRTSGELNEIRVLLDDLRREVENLIDRTLELHRVIRGNVANASTTNLTFHLNAADGSLSRPASPVNKPAQEALLPDPVVLFEDADLPTWISQMITKLRVDDKAIPSAKEKYNYILSRIVNEEQIECIRSKVACPDAGPEGHLDCEDIFRALEEGAGYKHKEAGRQPSHIAFTARRLSRANQYELGGCEV